MMLCGRRGVMLALLAALLVLSVNAVRVSKYKRETNVPVYTNKIGPFANPSVAYHYNNFPLCKPSETELKRQRQGLADKLEGTLKQTSLYAIKYRSMYPSFSMRYAHLVFYLASLVCEK